MGDAFNKLEVSGNAPYAIGKGNVWPLFITLDDKPRELPRTHLNAFVLIENSDVGRVLGLGVIVHVQELDAATPSESYGAVVRSHNTDDPKHVQIRESDVTATIHFDRLALRTFDSLLLGLHTVNLPV